MNTAHTQALEEGVKIAGRYAVAGLTALAVVVSMGLAASAARADGKQIIKFSHKLHVQDNGMACTDCHTNVAKSASLSDNLYPKMADCESCHSEQLQSSCTTCHLSADSSSYVGFQPTPVDLIFSHAYHLEKEKIECNTCHAGISEAETATVKHIPAMATCATCHDAVKAPDQCERCHTNMAALRPADHNKTNFVRQHKWLVRSGSTACASCHTEASCEDCHAEMKVQRADLRARDLVSPRSPRIWGIDRGQTQALTKVHDLNFRFTHGVEANAKTSDCATCHDTQVFCTRCHAAGGNVTQFGFRPQTHDQPGFTTFGRGTGGGLHATLAKRDIESCAACHDASGADPVCVTCHVDVDGIKGTDPRTHSSGMFSDVEGIWHSDLGATCFVCHADPNAHPGGTRGVGFCGYCHK